MGTPLWDVIDALGGGPHPGRTLVAAISGTANSALEATQFDTPLSYEGLQGIGSGLGTGGFIVFDDHTDLIAVAQGVAHFLSVESCGQCVPCKSDGLAIAQLLETERTATATPNTLPELARRFASVDDGARCALAGQQRAAVASLAELGREPSDDETTRPVAGSGRFLIAPIVDLVHGRAIIDRTQIDKLPDWSVGGRDSGTVPAELYGVAPVAVRVRATRTHGADTGVDVSTLDEGAADSGPSEASRRFTEPIVAVQQRMLDGLRSLRTETGADRRSTAASLESELGRYVSLVGTVVYPELDRMAGEGAEDLAWVAERNAESALEIVQRLRSVGDVGSDADGTLIHDLRALIDSDDTVVLPLLCRRLSNDELDRLADAVNEVVADGTESTARSSFGSAPS